MPEVIHIFSEQDSKGSLLAEVHRLQSSLAAMRQARDFHGANSAELMRERDRLQKEIEEMSDGINDGYRRDVRNAQLAAAWGQVNAESAHGPCSVCSDGGQEFCKRHGAKQEAPAPVDAGLMERMRASYHNNSEYCDEMALSRVGMTAALRVAAGALLGPVTDAEWDADYGMSVVNSGKQFFSFILAARRARLLAPEKAAEERVTVEIDLADGAATVLLDGKFQAVFLREKHLANALRLGLIATLKQEGAK